MYIIKFNELYQKKYKVAPSFIYMYGFCNITAIYYNNYNKCLKERNKINGSLKILYKVIIKLNNKSFSWTSFISKQDARNILCKKAINSLDLNVSSRIKVKYKPIKTNIIVEKELCNFMENSLNELVYKLDIKNVKHSWILSAFLHSSIVKHYPELLRSICLKYDVLKFILDYKTLEMLGDNILKTCIISKLMKSPDIYIRYNEKVRTFDNGRFTPIVSELISNKRLKEVNNKLRLDKYLIHCIDYEPLQHTKPYADQIEAIIGLKMICDGMGSVKEFIFKHWDI